MRKILYTDEVLLYGLSRYFGLRKGTTQTSAGLVPTNLLLTLYRINGPISRNELMEAAGLSHITPTTFRTYTHYVRTALGPDSIFLDGPLYQLSSEAREEVEAAIKFIQEELEESIHPTLRKNVVAMVRTA